jgi:glycosyltransferase involved in cell wall biosynthesis
MTNVDFRGRLPREETINLVKGARFLIQPSECYENFPMAVAEAFACGTPVLCSRIGALQEIDADGRTGLQFTPADPQDLAAKVQWAWDHREDMAIMGKEARAEFEAKYTAEKNYLMLMELYQRATHAVPALNAEHALAAAGQSNLQ